MSHYSNVNFWPPLVTRREEFLISRTKKNMSDVDNGASVTGLDTLNNQIIFLFLFFYYVHYFRMWSWLICSRFFHCMRAIYPIEIIVGSLSFNIFPEFCLTIINVLYRRHSHRRRRRRRQNKRIK